MNDGYPQATDTRLVSAVTVAPGITRRELPTTEVLRAWIIDFEPGSQWPGIDVHEDEERYYVLSGEIVEGENRYPEGTYVIFGKGSSHSPGSETGGSILGLNVRASAFGGSQTP